LNPVPVSQIAAAYQSPEQVNGSRLAQPDGIVTPRIVKPATTLPGASARLTSERA
jgi:hypothetical protein